MSEQNPKTIDEIVRDLYWSGFLMLVNAIVLGLEMAEVIKPGSIRAFFTRCFGGG